MAKFFSIPFAETGDKISPPNPTQADGTVSYSQGFGFDYQRKTDGTDPLAKVFPREQFNGIVNDITGAVGEIQLNGLAIWQDLTPKIPYPVGALVRYNNKNWVSLAANNTVTPVEGGAWAEISANGYTKVQVDAKLALKADKSSTLAGYGITDAYTKTESDARYAQRSNNLSDLTSTPTARSNLGLGTASTANVTVSATDGTPGRVTRNGDWGIGSTAQAPGITDFKSDLPSGIYSGIFSTTANGPSTQVVGYTAMPTRYLASAVQWLVVSSNGVVWVGYHNLTSGAITWHEQYSRSNVSDYSQTLLSLSSAAEGRSRLGVADGIGVNQSWQNLTASRAVNTTYTNSTTRTIEIQISCTSAAGFHGYMVVDGVNVVRTDFSANGPISTTFSIIIPPGSTYRLNTTTVISWSEMR